MSVADLLAAGRSLPSFWFHDEEIFTRERAQIRLREWVYVGPASAAKNTGDYVTSEVAGVALLIVRGNDEALRAV